MGTISSAKAFYGLKAVGTPTGTNVGNNVEVGVSTTPVAFSDANVAYSFKVTSTGATDVATLTFSSGSVAQTTGTPTITDGDGKDFEGATLGTLATLYAVLVERSTGTGSVGVTASSDEIIDIADSSEAFSLLQSWAGGIASPGTLALSFDTSGDIVTVTVLGKTA